MEDEGDWDAPTPGAARSGRKDCVTSMTVRMGITRQPLEKLVTMEGDPILVVELLVDHTADGLG